MSISRAKMQANNRWNKKAYEQVQIRVKRGQKAIVQSASSAAGESLNAYTLNAVMSRMASEGFTLTAIPDGNAERNDGAY